MSHEGQIGNKTILETYLFRMAKRLIGLSSLVHLAELEDGKEQHKTLETLGKLVEHEGNRLCEVWRSLCPTCQKMTIKEIYKAEGGKEQ